MIIATKGQDTNYNRTQNIRVNKTFDQYVIEEI